MVVVVVILTGEVGIEAVVADIVDVGTGDVHSAHHTDPADRTDCNSHSLDHTLAVRTVDIRHSLAAGIRRIADTELDTIARPVGMTVHLVEKKLRQVERRLVDY